LGRAARSARRVCQASGRAAVWLAADASGGG